MPQFNAKQIEELIKLAPQAVAALIAIIGLIAGLVSQIGGDGSSIRNTENGGNTIVGPSNPGKVKVPAADKKPATTDSLSIFKAGKIHNRGNTVDDTNVKVHGVSIGNSIKALGSTTYQFDLTNRVGFETILTGQVAWDEDTPNSAATNGVVTIETYLTGGGPGRVERKVRVNRGQVKDFWIPVENYTQFSDFHISFQGYDAAGNPVSTAGLSVLAPRIEWYDPDHVK